MGNPHYWQNPAADLGDITVNGDIFEYAHDWTADLGMQ